MTLQTDSRRSLPGRSEGKEATRATQPRSRIVRLLNWALGPPIRPGNVESADATCRAVLVIDASGSMESDDWMPSRLEGAKAAAKEYCNHIAREKPDAIVTVIAYSDLALTLCRDTPAAYIDQLHRAINKITVFGSTSIDAGLKRAIYSIPGEGISSQIVLLSDGHNTGRSPLRAAAMLREKSVVECVGIGGSPDEVDERLMKKIASEYPDGTKRYRWIGSKEELVREYKKIAGRLMRP